MEANLEVKGTLGGFIIKGTFEWSKIKIPIIAG